MLHKQRNKELTHKRAIENGLSKFTVINVDFIDSGQPKRGFIKKF